MNNLSPEEIREKLAEVQTSVEQQRDLEFYYSGEIEFQHRMLESFDFLLMIIKELRPDLFKEISPDV